MGYDFKGGTVQRQVARRVRNAQGRLDDLRASRVARPPVPLVFGGLPPGAARPARDDAVLAVHDGAVEGRMEGATLAVASDTALLITGPNGAGKSTLLGALAGRIPLDAGSVSRRRGLRVGLLEQDVRFAEPRRSPHDVYERALGSGRAGTVPLADLGLVAPRDLDRPVGDLSVGQQRRLALALVIARPPHVLLLDEPTNHLSLALASELEEALGTYPGAVLIASHDRWLRRRWHGAHLRMEGGRMCA